MTIIPRPLLGADDDWIESFRGQVYPAIHDFLTTYTPAYGVGKVYDNQFVGIIETDEETIEQELEAAGLVRNPIACYKEHPDGRQSEGSWVLLADDDPSSRLDDGRQLHFTLLPRKDGAQGREIFAHEEYDWRAHPLKHLREVDFSADAGVSHARHLIDEYTYFDPDYDA